MTGDCHVQFGERLEGKFLRSTHLDFTVINGQQLSEQLLLEILEKVTDWINQYTVIEILKDHTKIKIYTNQAQEKQYAEVRIYYIGPLENRRSHEKIILDLSTYEQLFTDVRKLPVSHDYSDYDPEIFFAFSYSFDELFAEKIRAFSERARPRDLYDIINLYHERSLLNDKIDFIYLLRQKFARKHILFNYIWNISDHPQYNELLAAWDNMLSHQLADLNPIETYLEALTGFKAWLQRLVNDNITLPLNIISNIEIVKKTMQSTQYVVKIGSCKNKIYAISIAQEVIDDRLIDTTYIKNINKKESLSKKVIIHNWGKLFVPIIRRKLYLNIVENSFDSTGYAYIKIKLVHQDMEDTRHDYPNPNNSDI